MKFQKVNNFTQLKILYDSGFKKSTVLSKKLKIPLRTCQKYIKSIKEGQYSVQDHNKINRQGGHNRISNSKKKSIIKKIKSLKGPNNIKKLSKQNKISIVSIRKIMRENGYTYGRLFSHNFTKTQIKLRSQYCKEMQQKMKNLSKMLFTDETSFWVNKSRPNYGWHIKHQTNKGDDRYARNSLHSDKVHLWGGISSNGVFVFELFESNLTAELYLKILKKKQKEIFQIFKQKGIFLQDNDPKHKANKQLIHLPPYSPDLNPIEQVWSWLKRKVAQDIPYNLTQLKSSIRKHCKNLNKQQILPYINNLNQVYQYVNYNKGQFYKQ